MTDQPQTEAGKRYVYGSLGDMIRVYGYGWGLHTVIADIERQAATRAAERTLTGVAEAHETRAARIESLRVKEGDPAARLPYFDVATLIGGDEAREVTLDTAWAEAEASIGPFKDLRLQQNYDGTYTAVSSVISGLTVIGPTPAAALRALAARAGDR